MPGSTAEISPEVRDRLLEAWRGEIVAGRVYDLIAERMPPREADILRRMATAESGHRERLEARMEELGIPVPAPDSVRLSPWLRLQARIAPVDRLLAAREAAEDEEVGDLYKRSTGDPVTDELLRGIRREERAHSHAVSEMRSGIADGDKGEPAPVHPAQARSTSCSAARSGTGRAAAGSAARSTAPTMGSRRCSGSLPECRARPAGRASS